MYRLHATILLLSFNYFINCFPDLTNSNTDNTTQTIIQSNEIANSSVTQISSSKPHHLFIGRCAQDNKLLHQENIVLVNDGKSHVMTNINININGQVRITCVKIFDEIPNGEGGYPSYVSGGVGNNYIEFNVTTKYGKGFHFFVQIFGEVITDTN